MAILYKTDGTTESIKPKGKYFSLEELQDFVGGYIELVHTCDGKNMYVNEEGKMYDLPPNLKATDIANIGNDYICGNAIVVEESEEDYGDDDDD